MISKKRKAAIFYSAAAIISGVTFAFHEDISSKLDVLYTPNDPMAVANDFWLTVLEKDEARAHDFLLKPEKGELIPGYNKLDRANLSKIHQDNNVYFIETSVRLLRNSRQFNIPMYTIVASENGEFKVDLNASLASVSDAALKQSIDYYISSLEGAQSVFVDKSNMGSDQKTELLKLNFMMIDEMTCDMKMKLKQEISPDGDVPLKC